VAWTAPAACSRGCSAARRNGLCREAPPANPKGDLQELLQLTRRASPRYQLLDRQGVAHAQVFTVGVFLGEQLLAQADGPNKQAAEREAALRALTRLQDDRAS
jgi:ribonuclease-3